MGHGKDELGLDIDLIVRDKEERDGDIVRELPLANLSHKCDRKCILSRFISATGCWQLQQVAFLQI